MNVLNEQPLGIDASNTMAGIITSGTSAVITSTDAHTTTMACNAVQTDTAVTSGTEDITTMASNPLETDTVATPNDEPTTACERALAIPHILKSIISGLPPHRITGAKRVSMSWQATILRSKQIALARVLTAYFPWNYATPQYDTREMHFNQHLVWNLGFGRARPMSFRFDMPDKRSWTSHYLDPCLDEFVTNPRCSVMKVRIEVCVSNCLVGYNSCLVYVPTGVKIQDVVHVARMMVPQTAVAHQTTTATSTIFYAELNSIKGYMNDRPEPSLLPCGGT